MDEAGLFLYEDEGVVDVDEEFDGLTGLVEAVGYEKIA